MAQTKVRFDRAVEGATNIVDSGTEGTKVALGTTAQRGSTQGQFRFNSTTGLAEYYDGSQFKSIDAPPTVTSVDISEVDSQAGGNQTVVITGTNFSSGAIATFTGNAGTDFNAATTTVNSSTQITAVAPKASFLNAQEPYGIKVTNVSGLSNTLINQINVDSAPTWTTSAGSLGSILDSATGTHATVAASDVDGDTISYAETGATNIAGAGLSLNGSTGVISGDPNDVTSDTTVSFNLRATAGSKTADRAFSIIIQPSNPSGGDFAANYSYGGTNYRVLKFTASGNLVVPITKSVDYLLIGGGGSGGHHSGGGGGAGGLVWKTGQSLSAGTYAFSMGAGGITNTQNQVGNDGGNSTFNGHTALGGGGGAGHLSGGNNAGRSGGSGGGGQRGYGAGSATQPGSSTGGFGNSGASSGATNGNPNYAAYAGGGAGSAASNRNGGSGHSSFIGDAASTTAFLLAAVAGTDSSNVATTSSSSGTLYIAGGGGGSDQSNVSTTYPGGLGGGGKGSAADTKAQVESGLANTGSGSGGQSYGGGDVYTRSGGSGILIVRFTI